MGMEVMGGGGGEGVKEILTPKRFMESVQREREVPIRGKGRIRRKDKGREGGLARRRAKDQETGLETGYL